MFIFSVFISHDHIALGINRSLLYWDVSTFLPLKDWHSENERTCTLSAQLFLSHSVVCKFYLCCRRIRDFCSFVSIKVPIKVWGFASLSASVNRTSVDICTLVLLWRLYSHLLGKIKPGITELWSVYIWLYESANMSILHTWERLSLEKDIAQPWNLEFSGGTSPRQQC